MANLSANLNRIEQEDEQESVVTRLAYAVGVGLILLGAVMPHGERWTISGVALVAFSYLF